MTRRYRRALRYGVAATVEHGAVAFPHEYRTVVDVGSHKGQFALFAREEFPSAKIICVEPLEDERARIRRAVGEDVRLLAVAAGDRSGTQLIHISRASDSSSLLPITGNYTSAFEGTEEVSTQPVQVERLDALLAEQELARPVLLKIDVQGGELDVLRGAQGLLAQCDEIFVECSFVEFYEGQALADEVIGYLVGEGQRLIGAYNLVYSASGQTLQADLLFSREIVAAPEITK
jgi:FkbM family methyltransferase